MLGQLEVCNTDIVMTVYWATVVWPSRWTVQELPESRKLALRSSRMWSLLGVFGALPWFVDSNFMQDLDWAVLLTGNVAFMSVRLKKSMIAWTCRPNLLFSFSVLLISWSDMKTCCSGGVCMQPCGPNSKKATTNNQTQTVRIKIQTFTFLIFDFFF